MAVVVLAVEMSVVVNHVYNVIYSLTMLDCTRFVSLIIYVVCSDGQFLAVLQENSVEVRYEPVTEILLVVY